MDKGKARILAARLFQRDDRLVGMRLEKLHDAHSSIPRSNAGPEWAETYGMLEIRDRLIGRAGQKLAPADMGVRRSPAAVECDRPLVFGNGLLTARLRP